MQCYDNLELSKDEFHEFVDAAQDYANTHGLVMRNRENPKLTNFAPFVLFPSPFSKVFI